MATELPTPRHTAESIASKGQRGHLTATSQLQGPESRTADESGGGKSIGEGGVVGIVLKMRSASASDSMAERKRRRPSMATECGYSDSHLHFRRLISTSDIHIPDLCRTHTDTTLWTIGTHPPPPTG